MKTLRLLCLYLQFFLFTAWNQGYAKIYDCFPFFNELDILDIRLHELYDHVDKFVLVESIETFQGNLKPLYFLENQHRFEKFLDKIIHIVLYDRMNTTNPWDRERYQRDQIMRGLTECAADDLIIISDLDEIFRATSLPTILKSIYQDKLRAIICAQTFYRYYLDCHCSEPEPWLGSRALTYRELCKMSPETLRRNSNYPLIHNAGWHFTYMGGPKNVEYKFESFSHKEYNLPQYKFVDFTRGYIQQSCKIVPIDDSFPKFVIENKEYFEKNGFLYGSDEVALRD
jgi:hypothetical protein